MTDAEERYGLYSDLHKDARGFRPRCADHFYTLSAEDQEAMIAYIAAEVEASIEAEANADAEYRALVARLGLDPARAHVYRRQVG